MFTSYDSHTDLAQHGAAAAPPPPGTQSIGDSQREIVTNVISLTAFLSNLPLDRVMCTGLCARARVPLFIVLSELHSSGDIASRTYSATVRVATACLLITLSTTTMIRTKGRRYTRFLTAILAMHWARAAAFESTQSNPDNAQKFIVYQPDVTLYPYTVGSSL